MNYKTTSDFSYEVDGQSDKIDEKIYFNSISPDQLNIVNQYYSLIKEGKIEEAIKYINESKVHTFNASLFNCIGNRIASLERYYYEKYWESNHWTTDEEQKFELRNNEQYLFLNPSMVDDGETVAETTVINNQAVNFCYGLLDQDWCLCSDFAGDNPLGTIYPSVYDESTNTGIYNTEPYMIKRGNFNFSVVINPYYEKYIKSNFEYIEIAIFHGVYGYEDRVIAVNPKELSTSGATVKNVNIAESLIARHGILANFDADFKIADVYDTHYDDPYMEKYFNIIVQISNSTKSISLSEFEKLMNDNIIQFCITPID